MFSVHLTLLVYYLYCLYYLYLYLYYLYETSRNNTIQFDVSSYNTVLATLRVEGDDYAAHQVVEVRSVKKE